MKKRALYTVLLIIFFTIIIFFPKKIEKTEYLFDTLVTIKAYAVFPNKAKNAIKQVFQEMKRIDTLDAPYINSGRYSDDVLYLIKKGVDIGYETRGAFDISVGALMKVWGRFEKPILPLPEEIKDALLHTGFKKIKIKGDSLILPQGLLIDPGGIAKGYAIDKGIEILRENGIRSSLINAGGDIGITGPKPFRRKWKVGIRNPRGEGIVGFVEMERGFIATSGDYERYFILNGKRYCHILNPATGYPASGAVSATVIAPTGLLADVYSTAAFVFGEKGIKFLQDFHLEGLCIIHSADSLIYMKTSGFKLMDETISIEELGKR